jgi:hypothetical protein
MDFKTITSSRVLKQCRELFKTANSNEELLVGLVDLIHLNNCKSNKYIHVKSEEARKLLLLPTYMKVNDLNKALMKYVERNNLSPNSKGITPNDELRNLLKLKETKKSFSKKFIKDQLRNPELDLIEVVVREPTKKVVKPVVEEVTPVEEKPVEKKTKKVKKSKKSKKVKKSE